MTETLFDNARNRVEQSCPPIWMMRQAGRYQASYRAVKEKFSFVQMCKLPQIASSVAMLPIDEYDFDVAILFSDILFHIEALGIPLQFDPGPKFEFDLTEDNYKNHQYKQNTLKHLQFQARAIKSTKEKLPFKKNLVGFVGGPWTLMNYACGESKVTNNFKIKFINDHLLPFLKASIRQQTEAGASASVGYDTSMDLAQSTSFIRLGRPLLTDNDASLSGSLIIYNPSSTTFVKHYMYSNQLMGSFCQNSFGAGYFNTTSSIDAFQFKIESGNIDAGTIKLYGIKDS